MEQKLPTFTYDGEIDLLKKCILWILHKQPGQKGMDEKQLKKEAQELATKIIERDNQ